jgi:hypothetical protein
MADEGGAIEFSPRSTALLRVEWRAVQAEADVGTLTVTFASGRSYSHEDVPRHVVLAFRDATSSAGRFYNAEIKGSY